MNSVIRKMQEIERLFSRIQNQDRDPIEYEIDLNGFFVSCWSLKDYIKNDTSINIPNKNQIVEDYANNDTNLRICADIANGIKHLTLKSKRVDAKFSGSNISITDDEQAHIAIEESLIDIIYMNGKEVETRIYPPDEPNQHKNSYDNIPTVIEQNYYIEDNMGTRYNAFVISQNVLQAWKKFLKSYNIY